MPSVQTVFLDRDGVVNRVRPGYVTTWEDFRFLPGALWAVRQLTRAGHRVFVVTNQACVGKGLVPWGQIEAMHARMVRELERAGSRIEAVLCCPHAPDARCGCRKPAPGLLLRARDEYGVDLSRAMFVGDTATDMQAAAAAGVPAILVLSGLGWRTAMTSGQHTLPECQLALNLAHAARLILRGPAAPSAHANWLRQLIRGAQAIEGYTATWKPG